MKRTIALFLALALLSGCADSSAITAEALKKSKGKYYIGEVELTAHTDENYEPSINITQSYSMDFDGNGKKEHFVILRYLDIAPEFIPYETDCCVFVSESGNAELVIPKSIDMRMGIIQGDGLKHIVFEGGCNNTTSFFSRYSVKDGKPYKPAIWRVEFSIKSSAQRWFVIDRAVHGNGKIVMPHTLSLYDSKEKLLKVFASLAEHYFHFKYYDPDTRKDRCKDKVLFNFSPLDTFYKVDRLASHKSDSKPFQRLLTLLRNYMLMHVSAGDKAAIERVIDMIETDILRMMKNPNTTQAEVLALRQVMKERIAGIRDKSVTQRIAELTEIINNSPDLF